MQLSNARVDGLVVDLAVRDGRIAAIAPSGRLDAVPAELTIDLGGRWLIPGLWDNHVHFGQWALHSHRLDVSSARSAAETAKRVADAIADRSLFVAVGFRDALWPDVPTRELLDEASGAPIVVVSGDLHSAWLNSAALQLYGFESHPTGLLREDDSFDVVARVNTVSQSELDGWAAEAATSAAARGLVGIVDYEMADNAEAWMRRAHAGAGTDSLRVEFGIYEEHLDAAIDRGFHTGDRLSDLVTVGNLKVLTDGSLNTRTAYCYDEYPGLSRNANGLLTVAPDRLEELMRRAADAGIHSSVHAIGDHANTLALDAFERVGTAGRIEHAQLLATADIPRFARLGVVASVQPDHAMDDQDVAEHYWPGRTDRAFPLRSLLDAGTSLVFGSDAPVSPLDPWSAIAAAVTRTRDGRQPWHPEQCISVEEAIRVSVRTRIRVGEPADLVVLDRDPLAASSAELRGMPVAATILAGRFTHNVM